MEEAAAEDGGSGPLRGRHIKKRALKNKSLSVSFNEKDLKDYVTGFHKRKKKRRREALQKQEEAERRKRIEQRKKRKLERDFVMFGRALPGSGAEDAAEPDEENEHDEDTEPVGPVSVTVTTREIAREEDGSADMSGIGTAQSFEGFEKGNKQKTPVARKKLIKKPQKKRSRAKPQSKRDKKKGKKKNKNN
ncbi:nucleolar protein 12 [Striga asiatica]|uniref:Nucleolar protein 12 n=1 Tax=Striga asiatica TaxID=4170 RepID=A0A5A7PFH2_STRAF|nr:nucleolar protein 12 [Striga asiatica]